MTYQIGFSGGRLDRAGTRRNDPAWLAATLAAPETRFVAVNAELKVAIDLAPAPHIAWRGAEAMLRDGANAVLLGLADGVAHVAVDRPDMAEPPPAAKFIDLRSIAPQLRDGEAGILAQAKSMIDWHRRHRFCAVCGHGSQPAEGGYVRHCTNPECKAHHFPRTDPVAIMLVVHGSDVLLGRQRQFVAGAYSALAGFIEPGETIEEAVAREIAEEAGITVGRVRYLASQPWPFPSSLMIGCVAEALTREITIDTQELEDCRWFARDEVVRMVDRALDLEANPRMPPPLSLAHQLARMWLDETA